VSINYMRAKKLPSEKNIPSEKRDWAAITPILISTLALIISVGGFLYTIRTYSVSHRPYLGIVESNFQLVENPPRAIIWKFIVKNTGSQPTVLHVDESKGTLTTTSGVSTLPTLGDIGNAVSYVMPGQTIELIGQYTEVGGPVKMEEILNGSVLLDVYTRLSYTSEGALGNKKYTYSSQIRFHTVKGVAPGFTTVKAEGD
jgi:hypothetical protein